MFNLLTMLTVRVRHGRQRAVRRWLHPKCDHYILIYLCAKLGAFIKKCTTDRLAYPLHQNSGCQNYGCRNNRCMNCGTYPTHTQSENAKIVSVHAQHHMVNKVCYFPCANSKMLNFELCSMFYLSFN